MLGCIDDDEELPDGGVVELLEVLELTGEDTAVPR